MGNEASSSSDLQSSSLGEGTTGDRAYLSKLSEPMKKLCAQRRGELQDGVAKQLSTTEEEELLEVLGLVLCDAESGGTTGDSTLGTTSIIGGSKRKDDLVHRLLEDDLEKTKLLVKRRASHALQSNEEGGKQVAVQPCSYLEALVACLYYEDNLEMQIISTKIIMHLVDARLTELPLDASDVRVHGYSQLLRFRLGLLGAIPPLVLLTFQGLTDLQLIGARALAGMALQPSNRAAIAQADGLRPLCILSLSDTEDVRLMAVMAIKRLIASPWESNVECAICGTLYASTVEGCPKCQRISVGVSGSEALDFGGSESASNGNDEDNDKSLSEIREQQWELLMQLPGSQWLAYEASAIKAGVRDLWHLYLDGLDSAKRTLEADENSADPKRSAVPVVDSWKTRVNQSGIRVMRAIPHSNVEKVVRLNGVRSLCTLLLRSLNDPGSPTGSQNGTRVPGSDDPLHKQQFSLQDSGLLQPVSAGASVQHQMDRKISIMS